MRRSFRSLRCCRFSESWSSHFTLFLLINEFVMVSTQNFTAYPIADYTMRQQNEKFCLSEFFSTSRIIWILETLLWKVFGSIFAVKVPNFGHFWDPACDIVASLVQFQPSWLALGNFSNKPLTIGPAEIYFWRSRISGSKNTFRKLQFTFFTVSQTQDGILQTF